MLELLGLSAFVKRPSRVPRCGPFRLQLRRAASFSSLTDRPSHDFVLGKTRLLSVQYAPLPGTLQPNKVSTGISSNVNKRKRTTSRTMRRWWTMNQDGSCCGSVTKSTSNNSMNCSFSNRVLTLPAMFRYCSLWSVSATHNTTASTDCRVWTHLVNSRRQAPILKST